MILFQNDGVLPIEGFTTFGMSSKPGSTNPIGKFGTGLKNAVAIILRLGGTITVWRGEEEYVFYTKKKDFRGKTFDTVRMKRRKGLLPWKYEALPFTTELGSHWEPWMVVRELEANCRDEANGKSYVLRNWENDRDWTPEDEVRDTAEPGRTLIAVDCAPVEEAFKDLDSIFMPEKKLIFENEDVRVFEGESKYIFYRGLRVTDLRKPSMYTYEMKYVDLTEDRTSRYAFIDDMRVCKALVACDDWNLPRRIVRDSKDYYEGGLDWDKHKKKVGTGWHYALSGSGLSPRFQTMRDNLDYGLGKSEDVDVCLEIQEWEEVLECLVDAQTCPPELKIREQLVDAGWKEMPRNTLKKQIDEIAAAYDALDDHAVLDKHEVKSEFEDDDIPF